MKNFEFLFDSIPPYPGQNIAIIENKQDRLIELLRSYCENINAILHVKTLSQSNIITDENIEIRNFSFEQKRYNNFAIDYDFLFLCVNVSQRDDISLVFKKIYRVMKNAGNLFVFINKDEVSRYFELLENTNFVALNDIDLNRTTQVITAKKMHGYRRV